MFIVHATVMEFKHCAKTNCEFKHSEEAQLGNMATLVAESAFHGLTYPENFCVGSLWQRHASLWMLIFFSCIFFQTELVWSDQKKASWQPDVFSQLELYSMPDQDTNIVFSLLLVIQGTDLKHYTDPH